MGLSFYRRRDGMLLGAAVGAGFSAIETLGYSFQPARVDGWYGLPLTLEQFRLGTVPTIDARQDLMMGAVRTVFLTINAVLGLLLVRYQWRRGGREHPSGSGFSP